MKTYFLVYRGDPKPRLDALQRLGKIEYVKISEELHCISFGPHHFEQGILNALSDSSSPAFLLKAAHPVFPRLPAKVQAEIDRLIVEGEDDSGCYIAT